jgi:hypothetical protein
MEKNAKAKLRFWEILIIVILFTSCATQKHAKNSVQEEKPKLEKYPNMDIINSKLSVLNGHGCGVVNTRQINLSHMIIMNGDLFDCMKRDSAKAEILKDLMYELIDYVDYENSTHYVNFFMEIRKYGDERFFEKYIELLRYDYEPEDNPYNDFSYAPVNEDVFYHLLASNIYSIDGELTTNRGPKINDVLFNFHDMMTTEEFYHYFKGLWEDGKIVLKSQVGKEKTMK